MSEKNYFNETTSSRINQNIDVSALFVSKIKLQGLWMFLECLIQYICGQENKNIKTQI